MDKAATHFCICWQFGNTVMIFTQSQLGIGTQHPLRGLAANFTFFEDHITARYPGANRGKNCFQASSGIGCTTDNLQALPIAFIHRAYLQSVGIGVAFCMGNFSNQKIAQMLKRIRQALHLQPQHRQGIADFRQTMAGFQMIF